VANREEINGCGVLAFKKLNFQFPHEADDRHPEVIPHHDDALHSTAVTLP
jgi:hypothetical protein